MVKALFVRRRQGHRIIPGCPPHPLTILEGLLQLFWKLKE